MTALALLAASPLAMAAEAPPALQPQRDVDITYKVPVPGGADTYLLQRLRWSASRREQRVDLPTSGQWMVLNFAAHRMLLVRDDSRQVVDLPAPRTADQPGAGAGYTRAGTATVDNLPCTEWRTIDTSGRETLACYTNDGVLLRATAGTHVLMEAVNVKYEPQPADIFAPPAGYATRQTNR
jgi:hypothetical protein